MRPSRSPGIARRALIVVGALCLLNVILFFGVVTTTDSIWAIPIARNLLHKGHL